MVETFTHQILDCAVWFLHLGNRVHAAKDLKWFREKTWEYKTRAITQSDICSQVYSLEMLGMTFLSSH